MRRREFITLLSGAAAACPLNVRAQQPDRVRHVGVIAGAAASDPNIQARYTAFVERLQQLGWTVGRNVRIDHRGSGGDPERLRRYAAELVALAPDLIMCTGGPATEALLKATRTVPTYDYDLWTAFDIRSLVPE